MEEDNITKAAQCIKKADFLLIAAGAGMGVDSGFGVVSPRFQSHIQFKDVDELPMYKEMHLTYAELASPKMLPKKPGLFFGSVPRLPSTYLRILV
jgi:hypothetical protein